MVLIYIPDGHEKTFLEHREDEDKIFVSGRSVFQHALARCMAILLWGHPSSLS